MDVPHAGAGPLCPLETTGTLLAHGWLGGGLMHWSENGHRLAGLPDAFLTAQSLGAMAVPSSSAKGNGDPSTVDNN